MVVFPFRALVIAAIALFFCNLTAIGVARITTPPLDYAPAGGDVLLLPDQDCAPHFCWYWPHAITMGLSAITRHLGAPADFRNRQLDGSFSDNWRRREWEFFRVIWLAGADETEPVDLAGWEWRGADTHLTLRNLLYAFDHPDCIAMNKTFVATMASNDTGERWYADLYFGAFDVTATFVRQGSHFALYDHAMSVSYVEGGSPPEDCNIDWETFRQNID